MSLRDAVHAEWTKLRTVPATGPLLVATVGLTVAVSAATAAAVRYQPGLDQDPTKISLTGVQLGQALVVGVAILMVGNEYGTGMIGPTLAAVPRRGRLLAAKATILGATVLATATVAVLGSVLGGRLLLPGNGFTAAHGFPPLSLADGSTLRATAGSIVYLVLVALLGLGVAVVARDAATTAGVMLGVLYVLPVVADAVADPDWQRHVEQATPTSAGLAIQATTDLRSLPIGPWAGLGVLAAWATATLAVGGVLLCRRDA